LNKKNKKGRVTDPDILALVESGEFEIPEHEKEIGALGINHYL
jgi:hypothetical protein